MKIKAIVELNIDIEEMIHWLGLNKNSTHIDIVREVEKHIEEIESTERYTLPEETLDILVDEVKKFLKK